ncbi:MAG: choice-of-anchor B family protein [Flavobacteriales bacterium]|nr:choice-of-anchor B family protein [Flavobacteriales bacterium]
MIRPLFAFAALLPSIGLLAQVNITQVGQYDYQAARNSDLSNLWGYVDELGNEYALVGVNGDPNVPGSGGFSVVDVTDPANPVEVYFTPGPNSIWREIKTWGDFAYMTTEAQAGLYIIDLTPLPGGTPTVTLFNGNGWDTSHSLFIDENGRLYLHGANRGNGGVIMYDLTQDPNNPVEVGEFDQWYCHDSYARGDTLYAAHINDGFFSIVDVSDPANPVLLGTQFTPNNFTHNTWLDDSGQYLFTTDEKPNSYVAAYDVSDPTDIQEVDRLQTSPGSQAIVHNTYWLNDYVVQSYYTEGVSIYDVQDPTNMVEVGHYDSSPFTGSGFNGAWGVYPYLPSGRLLVSDIEEGLFILEPTYVRGCYLEGTVTNAVTLAAVNNATVNILATGVSTLSGFAGGFAMGYHTAGTYTVEVSAPGYFPATVPGVVLQNGVLTVQDVQLDPIPTSVVAGDVVGPAPGQAGAVVVLDNGTQQYTGTTAADGTFTITGVTYGTYDVAVGLWGFQPLCITGLVVDANTPAQTFTLLAGYADDFSLDLGWQQVTGGSSGTWVREAPVGTTNQGQPCAPGTDVTGDCGEQAYVTGNGGGAPGDDDVDGGAQELTSPAFDASQMADPHVRFSYWFFNGGGQGTLPNDTLRVALINGTDTIDILQRTLYNGPVGQWIDTLVRISDVTSPGAAMRLYVNAADRQPGHLVEGGIDAFEVLADPFAGVALLRGEGALRLWPNPGADRFAVDARANEVLRILDVQGRTVLGPVVMTTGANAVAADLAEGVYLVRIEGAEGVRAARWVVQR